MTLQNGLIEGGKAYLWVDTLLLSGETGKPLGVGPKAWHGLEQPWAASLTMIGNPDYLSIPTSMARVNPQDEDSVIEAAQIALMDYCADGSFGRILLACCFDEPRLYAIASDTLLGVPFAAYTLPHYLAPAAAGDTRKVMMLAEMPAAIAEQVTGNLAWHGSSDLKQAPQKIGGTIVEIIVSRHGVAERELRLSGKAARALKQYRRRPPSH
ncbi:MAG: hypothetical protein J7493_17110 [Porphyrobacter sp.]|nr:hypothetical protein [Porphyrobacter sp.]